MSSHAVILTRKKRATTWVKPVDSREDLVLMNNYVTFRLNGASIEVLRIKCNVLTQRLVEVSNNSESIVFFSIDVNRYWVVEQGIAIYRDLLLKYNRKFKGSNETTYILIIILRLKKFCSFKEGLFACNSVDLTVTDVEVTIRV